MTEMVSISKAEHLPSFWNRGPGELGSGFIKQIPHQSSHQKFQLKFILWLEETSHSISWFLNVIHSDNVGIFWKDSLHMRPSEAPDIYC